VGSALTYAKRYALQGMVAIAPKDEDDDGEKARGGNHEMASGSEQVREPGHHPVLSPGRQAGSQCPACKRDAIIKSRAEYGGGWLCHKKRGGCGMRWPEDAPLPLTADESVPF
jgi:hypothetical protein